MKKIIIPFVLVLETVIILLLFLVQNKNRISRNSNVYEIRLDNGCKGQIYFDTTDENQLYGLTLIDEKNNHLNIFLGEPQNNDINLLYNDYFTNVFEIENGADKFWVHTEIIEGKTIVYAVKVSDITQIINAENFYENGIFFQPEGPVE